MDKRTGTLVNARPTTDSPVLDTEMVEEYRLAWQQLATGPHLRRSPDGDHPMLGDNDDVTGDDWESLDAEDFLMGEADPKQILPTDRQVPPQQPKQLGQQPETASVNRQTDPSAAQKQLQVESVSRQTDSTSEWRQLAPQFPVATQMQDSADGQDWQVVAARWWRQQRQQIQPRMGRLVEQAPQPRQQLPHPQRRMQRPDQWNFRESGEQSMPQPPSSIQRRGSSRGGRQVNPDPSEPPIQQLVNVEQLPQNPRLLNVGPKPTKWAGNTPLSAFKIDLILHYRATELPK